MQRAIITVGLGFGDEGKGATVDALTRRLGADLVVRYCGGSQAGHNVELPDGRRHTFSQFGAGTLAPHRPRTYLGPEMILDPVAMLREGRHLKGLGVADPFGLMTVHPRCLVTTYWHRTLNRLRELSRGADRHGSCGQGIGETRRYWLTHGSDAVVAADLRDPDVLRHKLELLRQRALLDLQAFAAQVPREDLREAGLGRVGTEAVARDLERSWHDGIALSPKVPDCTLAIFEGAQGVLLDEYHGFHPYTTWSTVTAQHAWDLVEQADAQSVCVLGITRSYLTRHGAGPLPTYSEELTERLRDPGNPHNPWQGTLRCGWLDLPLLRYAAAATGPLDGMVVNHLEQTSGRWQVCEEHRGVELTPADGPNLAWQEELTRRLGVAVPVLREASAAEVVRRVGEIAPVVVTGFGAGYDRREVGDLRFRRRRSERAGS